MNSSTETSQDKKALLLAISIERHNSKRYREWAMRFLPYDSSVSLFLEELALEELEHEQELLQAYQKHFHEAAPDNIPLPKELTQFAKGLETIKDHFFVINSFVAQSLLEMAIKFERYTQQFYSELLNTTINPELSKIYRMLGEFEIKHKNILLERLGEEQINSIEQMVYENQSLNEMQLR